MYDYTKCELCERINNFYMTNEIVFQNVDHEYVINSKLKKQSIFKMESDKKCEVGIVIKSNFKCLFG